MCIVYSHYDVMIYCLQDHYYAVSMVWKTMIIRLKQSPVGVL